MDIRISHRGDASLAKAFLSDLAAAGTVQDYLSAYAGGRGAYKPRDVVLLTPSCRQRIVDGGSAVGGAGMIITGLRGPYGDIGMYGDGISVAVDLETGYVEVSYKPR